MKMVLKLVLLLLLPAFIQAQTRTIDSLKQVLKIEKRDTSRVLLLNALSFAYLYSRPDTAILLAQQGLLLAKETGFARGEALSLSRIGLGFQITGNYPKALQLSLQALKKAEALADEELTTKTLSNIGNSYGNQGNYSHAVSYTRKSLEGAKRVHNQRMILPCLINLGHYYDKLNRLDTALDYTNQAYALSVQLNTVVGIPLNNLGNIYSKMGQNTVALHHYRASVLYYAEDDDNEGLCESYLGIAAIFQKAGKQDSCLYYAKNSLALAQKGGFTERVMQATNFLTNFYIAKHIVDSAFKYQSATIAAKDMLFSQEKQQELQNLSYEEMVRQQQITEAKAEAKTKIKFNMLFGGLGTLLLVAFLLFRNNRQKQSTNALLTLQKEKLEDTLQELKMTQAQLVQSEKMAALGELTAGVAHEIQNPLNFVNNFSEVSVDLIGEMKDELIAGNMKDATAIAVELAGNMKKIHHHGKRADSIVKNMLQHSRQSNSQKELTDINKLVDEYLRLSYQGLRANDKSFSASLETQYDPAVTKIPISQQDMGRVLLNVFNNAFYSLQQKKALQGKGFEPTIFVTTKKDLNVLKIVVKDNGMGIPQKVLDKIYQPFFTTKPTGEGTGLGLLISYDIITKGHGGTLKATTEEGQFAEFNILLPA